MTTIKRSISEPIRDNLSWDKRWKGEDHGLITCWETGRSLKKSAPELAEKANRGELPPLEWKGGIEKKLKAKQKTGTFNYLATWQGLRGEDLNLDTTQEPVLTCTLTGQKVLFTADYEKYKNA